MGKTYAQKISELQKPIPGQSNINVPMLKRVLPKEAISLPSQQSPSMPSLIPLTIDDMAKREAATASKGLHLSGGGVSDFSGNLSDFVLPSFTPLPLSSRQSHSWMFSFPVSILQLLQQKPNCL